MRLPGEPFCAARLYAREMGIRGLYAAHFLDFAGRQTGNIAIHPDQGNLLANHFAGFIAPAMQLFFNSGNFVLGCPASSF